MGAEAHDAAAVDGELGGGAVGEEAKADDCAGGEEGVYAAAHGGVGGVEGFEEVGVVEGFWGEGCEGWGVVFVA